MTAYSNGLVSVRLSVCPSSEYFELVHKDRQAVQQIYGVCKVGGQRKTTVWCLSVRLSVPHGRSTASAR